MNIIDLLCICPFYVEMLLPMVGLNSEALKDFTGMKLRMFFNLILVLCNFHKNQK